MAHGTRDDILNFNCPAVNSGSTYVAASDQASTDVIDLEAASALIGTGEPIYVKVVATADLTQTGTTVVSVQESSDNASTDAYEDIVTSVTYTNGVGATEGSTLLDAPLPASTERYLRVFFTLATGNITAGGFDAFLYTR